LKADGAGCMDGQKTASVTTCMENGARANGKTTRGGNTCREWDFLISKAISWNGRDAYKEHDFSQKEGNSWSGL
jgi:hypothetical protein